MNPTSKIFRGATIYLFASILAAGFGYLIRVLFARALTPAEYGLFYAVIGFVSFFAGFKALGLNSASVKYFAEFAAKNDHQHIKNTARYLFLVQAIVFLPFVILCVLFAKPLALAYFKDAAAAPVLIIISLAFLLSILETVFASLFLGLQRIKSFSTVDTIGNVFILLVAYALFQFMHGVLVPAYAYLGSFLLVPIVYYFLLKRVYPEFFTVRATSDTPLLKRLFGYGLPLTGGIVATSLLASADTLILTYFRTLTEVGFYQVALPIVALLRYLGKSVSTIILPISSELSVARKPELSATIPHVQRLITVIIVPLALSVVVFAAPAIQFLFGTQYLPAAPALQILGISAIFITIAVVNNNVLLGIGDVTSQAFAYILGATITVLLDLVLVPSFGIEGAAIGTTIGSFVMFAYSCWRVSRRVHSNIPLTDWLKTIIAGGIFAVSAWFFIGQFGAPVLEAIIGSLTAGIAYLLAVLILRIMTFAELKRLLQRVR